MNIYFYKRSTDTDDVHLLSRTLQKRYPLERAYYVATIYILFNLANGIVFPGAEKDLLLLEKMALKHF